MEINKSSWSYFVWSVSYKLFYKDVPTETNLCRYFWRIIAFSVFLFPIYCIRKLLTIEREKKIRENWITKKSYECFGDYHIKNSYIFILIIGMLWGLLLSIPFLFPILIPWYLFLFEVMVIVIVVVGSLVALMFLVEHTKSDKNSFIVQYIKAKKNKVCPLINFKS